jgi:hypothetical protein
MERSRESREYMREPTVHTESESDIVHGLIFEKRQNGGTSELAKSLTPLPAHRFVIWCRMCEVGRGRDTQKFVGNPNPMSNHEESAAQRPLGPFVLAVSHWHHGMSHKQRSGHVKTCQAAIQRDHQRIILIKEPSES